MTTGEPHLVVRAVLRDVRFVALSEPVEEFLDVLLTAYVAQVRVGEVGMHPTTVPVTREGLGMELDLHAMALGGPEQQIARHDQVVSGSQPMTEALVLPLTEHDLGVHAGDSKPRVQALFQMLFDDVAPRHVLVADRAVVGTLRLRVPTTGEPDRPPRVVHQHVLLLEAEPVVLDRFGIRQAAGVGRVRRAVRLESLRDDQPAVLPPGIGVDPNRLEDDLGVSAVGLQGGASVEIPLRQSVELARVAV